LFSSVAQGRNYEWGSKEFLISEEAKDVLMKVDKKLIFNLKDYADKLDEKANKLKRIVKEIREPLQSAKGNEEEYLSNPLNSFPLIRHLFEDWRFIKDFMAKPAGEEQIKYLKLQLTELPWQVNAKDATEAIYRIAKTYDVSPYDMANGQIDGIQFNSSLTAWDCFAIAKLHFQFGEYRAANKWMNITMKRMLDDYEEEHEVLGLTFEEVILMKCRCLVELGELDKARDLLLTLPELAEDVNNYLDLYTAHPYKPDAEAPEFSEDFRDVCSSSHIPETTRLHCRYNSSTSPFLKIAPLKMEEISLDPYIVVYHNVLPDREINEILRFESELEPTMVANYNNPLMKSKYRTALGFWLPRELRLLDQLRERIGDITGLEAKTLTSFQLLKYGFGAHYSPHYDFLNMSLERMKTDGDRIATVLFYLNDPPHGGATAFNALDIKVAPERGMALFWYNLQGETLDFDELTSHCACPVIHGTKLGELKKVISSE
ncbi:hypothetical protein KR009_000464, partial [Drosophila setifemur]